MGTRVGRRDSCYLPPLLVRWWDVWMRSTEGIFAVTLGRRGNLWPPLLPTVHSHIHRGADGCRYLLFRFSLVCPISLLQPYTVNTIVNGHRLRSEASVCRRFCGSDRVTVYCDTSKFAGAAFCCTSAVFWGMWGVGGHSRSKDQTAIRGI